MTNNKIPNPFEKEDWFSNIVWQDKNTRIKAKQSFSKFLKQHSKYTFFMSLKDSYTTIVNSITKHSITATFIMLLALGGVGASAAELVAPEEFKPSTIIQKTFNPDFKENKVPDKDPFTALKPDTDYDVVNFSECDLSIKYPKKIDDQEILVNYGTGFGGTQEGKNPIAGVSVNSFDIECYNKNDLKPIEKTDNGSSISQKISSLLTAPKVYADSEDPNNFILKPLDTKEFYDMTNWFIFEGEITDIYEITNFDEFKIPEYKDNEKYVRFTHKDKTYLTYFETTKIERSGGSQNPVFKKPMEAKQLQLQFNSLVPSEANAKIGEGKNSAEISLNNEEFRFDGFMNDGDNKYSFFLEKTSDKSIYLVKNVAITDELYKINDQNIGVNSLKIKVTGKAIAKKQAISLMDGQPDQKVDYEFTEFTKVELADKKTTASSSSTASKVATTTYTNPFFPGLKIVYPNDWKFETSTKPMTDKLVFRDVKLSKNGFILDFVISPDGPFGNEPIFFPDPKTCDIPNSGSSNELAIKNGVLTETKLSNNISKFYVKTNCKGWENINDTVYYGNMNVISFKLKSSIKGKDVNYEFVDPKDGYIVYNVSQIGDFKLSESKNLINEIDQIISLSTFK